MITAFRDAIPKGKEYDYSLPAVQGVQFCSRLFDCERYSKAKNHTAEQRKQFRHEKEKPILEAFWNWLDQQRPNKGTRLAKAVNYAQNRKDTLMTYLEDGHCSLSNNLSENAIRPFTVGRKNWLFSASPKGAASSAIVMQSDHSLLAGKTGCSVPVRRELPLALLCIQWLRWQKRMT